MDFPKKTDPEKAEIHILTGENGTGKSTILEALAHYIFPQEEQDDFDRTSHLLLKAKLDSDYSFSILNSLNESIKYSLNPHDVIIFQEKSNVKYYKKTKKYTETKFDYAFFAYSGYRKTDDYANKIDISAGLNANPFENALDFSKSTNTEYLLCWIGNYLMKYTLAISQNKKGKAEKIIIPVVKVQEIIESIIEKTVAFQLSDDLEVKILIDGEEQHFFTIADGVRSIVSWAGDLIMRLDRIQWNEEKSIFDRNFILFLDEIEVHLHPAWQRKILPVVQKLFKNAQIFISTHSPFVVGSVDGAWVHKLKKDGAYAVLDGEPILSEDAKSYDTILEEIFDVKERFGVQVEEDLKKFYQFKAKILGEEDFNIEPFIDLVSKLASESIELESMLGMELKQIKRLTGKDFLATA